MTNVLEEVEAILHPIKERVDQALEKARTAFSTEKGVIAADVKAALAKEKEAIKAATPALTADAEALLDRLIEAGAAALASHGL